VVAAISLLGYFGTSVFNPITEEKQHVGNITPEQEVALGLQAAPEMAQQFGGLDPDPEAQARVDRIGERLVARSAASRSPYRFEFHVLDDPETINAFALPGGQVFITEGLLRRLKTEGLTGAAVLATYDPNNPSTQNSAAVAAMIGQLVNMRFGRQDELESDRLGIRFAGEAGYDPRSMIALMKILDESSEGGRPPEFFSTHPNPENRIARIQEAIRERYPNGVPEGLER
jgi:predicted Zn-dependent protease